MLNHCRSGITPSEGDLECMLTEWITLTESHIADICGFQDKDRKGFCSRAQGPRFVWKNALGCPSSGGRTLSAISIAWRNIANWLTDIAIEFGPRATPHLALQAKKARWRLLSEPWNRLGQDIHAQAVRNWCTRITLDMLRCRTQVN